MPRALRAALLLLCGLTWVGCGKSEEPVAKQEEPAPAPVVPQAPPPPPEILETDSLAYLPPALTSAAGAHLGAVTDSANVLGETLLGQLQPVLSVFAHAGLTPAQVEHFWSGADRARNELLVCVRTKAKFDPELIRKGLGAQSQLAKQDRTEIYALPDHRGRQNSVAFVDDRTFLLGRRSTVQAATQKPASGSVRQGMFGLDAVHRHFWVAGDTAALFNRLNEGVLTSLASIGAQNQRPQAFAFGLYSGVQVASAEQPESQSSPAASSPTGVASGGPSGPLAGPGPSAGHASGPPAGATTAPPADASAAPGFSDPPDGSPAGGTSPTSPEARLSMSFESELLAQSIERVISSIITPASGAGANGQPAGIPPGSQPGAQPGGPSGAPPAGRPPQPGAAPGAGQRGSADGAPSRRPILRNRPDEESTSAGGPNSIVIPRWRDAVRSLDAIETSPDIQPQRRGRRASSSLQAQGMQGSGGMGGTTITAELIRRRNVVSLTLKVPALQASLLTEGLSDAMQSAGLTVLGDGIFDSTLAGLQRGLTQLATDKPDRYLGARLMPDKAVHAGSSWMIEVLPYIGRRSLYQRLDPTKTWIDDRNFEVAYQVIPEFLNPSDPRTRWRGFPFDGMALTHFVGMSGIEDRRNVVAATLPRSDPRAGVFGYDAIAKEREITDGLSQTIMLIGSGRISGPWAHGGGATIRGARAPHFDRLTGFGSTGVASSGAYVLMADGSAREISGNIDPKVFQALCTIHGAEQVDLKPVLQAER